MSDILRILFFVLALLALIALERWRPRIGGRRWSDAFAHYATNALYLVVNVTFLRLLFPLGLVGLAVALQSGQAPLWSLPQWLISLGLPVVQALALESAIVVLVFDFVLWLQHLLFHRIDWLWRLHRIHHSDTRLDVSTGFRFHPGEVFLSFLLKAALVCLLAPSAVALSVWLIAFNLWTLITHADIAFPRASERSLRAVFITPDLHRVHHLYRQRWQNSNYGTIFSVWDKIFGTQRALTDQRLMTTPVGLDEAPSRASQRS